MALVSTQALKDDKVLVRPAGRLDQHGSPELEATLDSLLSEGHYRLIIDMSQATYINSGGLRILVSAWRRATEQGGYLRLCGLNGRLTEVFAMIGFDAVFEIFADCKEATAA